MCTVWHECELKSLSVPCPTCFINKRVHHEHTCPGPLVSSTNAFTTSARALPHLFHQQTHSPRAMRARRVALYLFFVRADAFFVRAFFFVVLHGTTCSDTLHVRVPCVNKFMLQKRHLTASGQIWSSSSSNELVTMYCTGAKSMKVNPFTSAAMK
jgi:hypothetical protein